MRSPLKENVQVKRVRTNQTDVLLLVPIRRVTPVKLVPIQPAPQMVDTSSSSVITSKARRSLGGDFSKKYPLGLFDCNENKTQELTALLKKLSNDFIPYKNGNIVEPVFFGAKLTFSTESGQDPGTLYFYRNLLNHRGVKDEVKNAYRPYKLLFYTVFDAICQLILLHHFHLTEADSNIPFPEGFQELSKKDKVE
uniref:Uncharacterized protein n=1 Tax=Magallana gigas TaxID=29159 RepID=K1RIV3_MAGGI